MRDRHVADPARSGPGIKVMYWAPEYPGPHASLRSEAGLNATLSMAYPLALNDLNIACGQVGYSGLGSRWRRTSAS